MPHSLTLALRASALVALVALAQPAAADVLFQSATIDPNAVINDNTLVLQGDGTTAGNGFVGGSVFIGADFTIAGPKQVTSIGATFADTAFTLNSGAIFGAIVQVDPTTGLPTQPVETLSSITLGEVTFTPTQDGDTTAALSLLLQPGTYGLVFGSGLFGATGVADLLEGNDLVGSPFIFANQFAPFQQDFTGIDPRLFVNAVPEPDSLALLAGGLLLLTAVRRRRA
jgi:hypothetical protein